MLSIVLVTYRSWDLLSENIVDLYNDIHGKNPAFPGWEVVVIDNDCSETKKSAAFRQRFPKIHLIEAPGDYGYAYACNRGAEAAGNPFLVFGSADLRAPSTCFHALLEAKRAHPGYAILTAPQMGVNGKLQRAAAPFTKLWNYWGWMRAVKRIIPGQLHFDSRPPPDRIDDIVTVDWVSGSLLMINKDDLESVGYWSENYWLYCEDEDLCRRVTNQGKRVGFFPGPVFTHIHATSTRGSNEETALYKSETVLSKQVYLSIHEKNFQGMLLKTLIRWQTTTTGPIYRLLSLLTGRTVKEIEIGRLKHQRLSAYYRRVKRTGYEISEHAFAYDPEKTDSE